MYVTRVPNRSSPPAVLLRESFRKDGKVKTRTLANLTDWPEAKVEVLRRVLRGETLVVAGDRLAIERSLPHGHVVAVLGTLRRIGLDRLLPRRPERLATLALALIAARVVEPVAKLATGPPAKRGDGFALAGRGAGAGRGGRGRAVPCPRSVGRGPAGDREGAGEATSEGRHAGALRCHLELPRRPVLRARPLRLQPRRPSRPAADRLWAAVRRRRLPGGGRGVRRRHRRSEDAGGADCQAEGALQTEAGGAGRRPRHDHQCQDRRGAEARRARRDHRAAGARHSGARRRGRAVAAVAVRREGHGRDQLARFPGRAAGRLPQPPSGRRAGAQARRPARSIREGSREDPGGDDTPPQPAPGRGRDRPEGRCGAGAAQGRHFRLTITEETLGFARDAAAIAR